MTKKKKSKQLGLDFIWKIRISLRAEGDNLLAEGDNLLVEGDKLSAKGCKLRAEGYKLRAEGDKLWAKGVLEFHGNITMEWKNWTDKKQDYECHLETGEVFKP